MGYRLFRRSQISFSVVIMFVYSGNVIVGLWACELVILWVSLLWVCWFVGLCVCCVFVLVCAPSDFA